MKNKEKYDLNTLKIEWTPQTAERRFFTIKLKSDERTIFSKEMTPTETGTNAYNAWLEQEYKSPILDDVEKAYLSAFIKPFRKRIEYIEKISFANGDQFLSVALQKDYCGLPNFKEGTMYKGMELNKHYTLEELGL